jgi:hypothetical protein
MLAHKVLETWCAGNITRGAIWLQYLDLEMNITVDRSLVHFRHRVKTDKADGAVAPVADERRSWARINSAGVPGFS